MKWDEMSHIWRNWLSYSSFTHKLWKIYTNKRKVKQKLRISKLEQLISKTLKYQSWNVLLQWGVLPNNSKYSSFNRTFQDWYFIMATERFRTGTSGFYLLVLKTSKLERLISKNLKYQSCNVLLQWGGTTQ